MRESKTSNGMRSSIGKLAAAVALLAATWLLGELRIEDPRPWVRPYEASGPVRILQFYASAGAVLPGQTARLCYGVEHAKSVRISPLLAEAYPSTRHCLDVVQQHTTHYTILAEGYDGAVATRSLTIPVATPPVPEQVFFVAASDCRGVSECAAIVERKRLLGGV